MNIEINTTYTTREVLDIFGLMERTYYRHQEEFHEYLELYFNYNTWTDGYRRYYKFNEQYKEEIPPFKHKRRREKTAINEEIYTQVIDSEIKRNPYFTADSLALDKHNSGVFPEGHTVRTSRGYISKILNNGKYVELDPVLCKRVWNNDYEQTEYVPLTEEEVAEYNKFMLPLVEDVELIVNLYERNTDPQEYFNKRYNPYTFNKRYNPHTYQAIRNDFFKQHGYVPFSVRPIGIKTA